MAHDEDDESPDLTKVIEKVNQHVDTRMEYLRLLISEKVAIVSSKMGTMIILFVLFILFFLFVNIAAALWIGKRYDDDALGFGIISLFYLLCALIYMVLRKTVFEKKMQDTVVNALYPENAEEDEDE
jgi:hypothetical protein